MDHPSPFSRDLPWRTTALVASALAAFELVLLVMLATAFLTKPLLGGGEAEEPAARAERPVVRGIEPVPSSRRAPAKPPLPRGQTSVLVLNGNGSSGAAAEKADLVQTRGYIVTGTGNAVRTDFPRSIVMYRRGFRREALRLARDFGVRRVAPLDGMSPSELQGAHLALIVGAA